jgi:hypothetical protein
VIASQDNTGFISMTAGMRPTTSTGEPLLTLTIKRIPAESVPPVPGGAPYSFAGYAYEVEPSGASFEPYVTLSITISEADFASLQGRELFIKWYNPATSAWEDIPTTVDPASRTASAKITHTSIFGLFATNPPVTPTVVPTTTAAPLFGSLSLIWIILIVVVIVVVIIGAIFLLKRNNKPGEPPGSEDDWKLE